MKKTSRGSIVILVDVNLLVYVGSPASLEHERAREWFEDRMNSGERVGLPWHSLFGFLRVATKRSVASESLAMNEALLFVEEWLEWDTVWVPEPTVEHLNIVGRLLRQQWAAEVKSSIEEAGECLHGSDWTLDIGLLDVGL